MKLFWRFIRTDIKKSKRNYALFGCTIFLGVIAIVISLLLTRTGKLLYADTLLSDYGNYDVAFCQVSDKLKDVIEKELGLTLDWQRLDGKKASRIVYRIPGLDFDDHSNYDTLMNEAIDKIVAFSKVFKKYMK